LTFNGHPSGPVAETYILQQCGTPPLDASVLSLSLQAPISIPLPIRERIIGIEQTSMITPLEILGLRSAIKTTYVDTTYISSPCVQELIASSEIVSSPSSANGWTVPLVPDVTLNFLDPWSSIDAGVVHPIRIMDYNEPKLLGKTETLKFYSLFFNMELSATEAFNKVEDEYSCVVALTHKEVMKRSTINTLAWATYSDWTDFGGNAHKGWSLAKCNGPSYEYV
jgi:hypothetical protein